MRVLLVAFGTRGDVQPLVTLGQRLQADGHRVSLGAAASFGDWVRGHGLEPLAIGADIEGWVRAHGDALTRHPGRLLGPSLEFLRRDLKLSLDQIDGAARSTDLIVSGLHGAAPTVAEARGIPQRTLIYCPQILRSRHHPPMGCPWLTMPRALNALLWRLGDAMADRVFRPILDGWRRRRGLPPLGNVMAHWIGDRPILACDAALAVLPPDAPVGAVQTGSIASREAAPLDPALEQFLAAGEPPVCVGFGSMSDGDPRRTTRVILDAFRACDCRGILLGGWAGIGATDLPAGVHAVAAAPHVTLFPRVAMVVHHGGAGTTAAAARAGVPQIVVPHIADQFYWGRQVWTRGLGAAPIPRPALDPSRLARAIRWVAGRPEIGARARAIGAEIAKADGASEVVAALYGDEWSREDRRRSA